MSTGGLSKGRLDRMHDLMAGYVARGEVPGIITLSRPRPGALEEQRAKAIATATARFSSATGPTGSPALNPKREDKLPLVERSRLVATMDRWQLCHLALSVVLPLRPDEAAGLLISEVNFAKGWLEIGTRLGGADFTKGRTSFKLPFPDEVRPLLRACIGGRQAGPLLCSRSIFEGHRTAACGMSRIASTPSAGCSRSWAVCRRIAWPPSSRSC